MRTKCLRCFSCAKELFSVLLRRMAAPWVQQSELDALT